MPDTPARLSDLLLVGSWKPTTTWLVFSDDLGAHWSRLATRAWRLAFRGLGVNGAGMLGVSE